MNAIYVAGTAALLAAIAFAVWSWLASRARPRNARPDLREAPPEPLDVEIGRVLAGHKIHDAIPALTSILVRIGVDSHLRDKGDRATLIRQVGRAWDREMARALERNDRRAVARETRQ